MSNAEKLDKVLAYIEANPKKWDQEEWVPRPVNDSYCGTACCIAGNAALLAGCTPLEPDHPAAGGFLMYGPHGGVVSVNAYAKDVLGLDADEADVLFSAGNSPDDLREIVAALKDGSFEAWGFYAAWDR
jgi:hypothetical protein